MTTLATPTANDQSHFDVIKAHLPDWLLEASPGQRRTLRQSLIASCHSRHEVHRLLATLQSPTQWLKPMLEQAIAVNFRLDLDAEQATLVHVHRNDYFFGLISLQGKTTEQTLLSAALRNFEPALTSSEAFATDSGIYPGARAEGNKTRIKPEEFALVCRRLDFGRLYQAHLRAFFEASAPATDEPPSSTRDLLVRSYRDDFAVAIHLAGISRQVSSADYQVLLDVLDDRHVVRYGTQPCSLLDFLGMPVSEVLVIGLDADDGTQPCIVYIPQDPLSPLAHYDSAQDFESELSRRLLSAQYTRFFSRFLPPSDQGQPLEQLIKEAIWKKWSPRNTHALPPVLALLSLLPVQDNPFKSLHQRRMQQIECHARNVVVPTATIDAQARQRQQQAYVQAGLGALTLALSFLPLVGDILLVFSAAQLIREAYDGFDAWRRHEKVEALNYLMDVAEQVALMGASAGTVKAGRFVKSLVHVRPSVGRSCLWKPDLEPYQQGFELPEAVLADEQGLYTYQGKHYLALDQQLYEVGHAGDPPAWSIRHPDDPWAYSPPLLHNGSGAWRTVHERPQDWSDLTRLRRLGPVAADTRPEDLAPILHASASDARQLLDLHLENRPAPAQLADTLKRFQLDRQLHQQRLSAAPAADPRVAEQNAAQRFDALYRQSEQVQGALPEQIRKDFPRLPKSYVQSLARSISPSESQQIRAQKSWPAHLEEEARLSLQNLERARLHEDLYLHSRFNANADLLAFQALEALAGWSGQVRLELHVDSLAGSPAASVGDADARILRHLLRDGSRYQVHDADGRQILPLTDLYSAIGQALPEAEWNHLGIARAPRIPALKRSLAEALRRLDAAPPNIRRVPAQPASLPSRNGAALDTHFALPVPPDGLTPLDDGLYRDAAYQHYIEERGRYYPVERAGSDYRLIDARNPARFYRPVLQRRAGHWQINTGIGLKGGAPGPGHSKIVLVESDSDMVSALEYVKPEPFTAEDLQRMKTIKSYQRAPNRMGDYDRANNGRYPLRGLTGDPLRIRKIQHLSEISDSARRYPAKDILPYLKWEQHEKVAQLYEEKLLLRPFTEQDAKFHQEKSMIGQAMVVARKPLKAGEAIGVYGGSFIPMHVANVRKDPYVIDISPKPLAGRPTWDRLMLSGDNIISRINSIFEYEDELPVRQAATGYNVEGASFPVDVDIGEGRLEPFLLHGFFTTRDIPADEELRWNYGYSEDGIRTTFALPEAP